MDFVLVRNKLELSQPEMAVLLGVPASTLKGWEQKRRTPDSAVMTLYRLLVDQKYENVIEAMLIVACEKRYVDISDVRSLLRVVERLVNKPTAGIMEVAILLKNPQWSPEELGFRVTKVTVA